jgi:hypothetical protein
MTGGSQEWQCRPRLTQDERHVWVRWQKQGGLRRRLCRRRGCRGGFALWWP